MQPLATLWSTQETDKITAPIIFCSIKQQQTQPDWPLKHIETDKMMKHIETY